MNNSSWFVVGYFAFCATMFWSGYLHRGEMDKLRKRWADRQAKDGQ